MSDLKTRVDDALQDLERKRIEYSGKVQELEDICDEFEKQAINLLENNRKLILLLKQVKHKITEGKPADVLDMLAGY